MPRWIVLICIGLALMGVTPVAEAEEVASGDTTTTTSTSDTSMDGPDPGSGCRPMCAADE